MPDELNGTVQLTGDTMTMHAKSTGRTKKCADNSTATHVATTWDFKGTLTSGTPPQG